MFKLFRPRSLGKSIDEVIGLSLSEVMSEDYSKVRRKYSEKVSRSGNAVRFLDERDGRIYDISIYPVFDSRGTIEESILSNIQTQIVPYIEKIKNNGLDEKQLSYVNILESNLNDIISPFSRKIALRSLKLTPFRDSNS